MTQAAREAAALLRQYLSHRERLTLDRAITLFRSALRGTPSGTPEYASCRSNLLVALTLRRAESADRGDLDELVALGRESARSGPRRQDLVLLGLALRQRHDVTGAAGDLDEAIDTFTRAMELSRVDDVRVPLLNDRALALRARHERDGNPPDLAAAASDLRQAIDRLASGAEQGDEPPLLVNLAGVHRALFEAAGDPAHLDQAVGLYRAALAGLPPDASERPVVLGDFAESLRLAGEAGVAGATLEGIDACRQALSLGPPDHPHRPELLKRLGALLGRAVEQGDRDTGTLAHAVDLLRQAVRMTPPGDARLPDRLQSLANGLHRMAVLVRDPGLLDEAIACLRQAAAGLAERPRQANPRTSDRARHNLALALRQRHLGTGDLGSLREAVALARDLWRSPFLARDGVLLGNLSVILQSWADATGDASASDEAVAAARAALRAASDSPSLRAARLNTLANALRTRCEALGDRATHAQVTDVDEAISLLEQAIALLPQDAPSFARTMSNLGSAWRHRAQLTEDRAALEQAVTAHGRAVLASEPWPARRASYLANHGDSLRLMFESDGDPGVLRAAADVYRRAARTTAASPQARALAARDWGETAAVCRGPEEALEAFRLAVELLPLVAPRHLARHDQQRSLARLNGLAPLAATSAIDAGDVRLAVRLLEQGRGTILGHLFESRGELADLRSAHPEAADRLVGLRERLDVLSLSPEERDSTDERHALAARWEEEVARIRSLPGFADFLALPSLDALLAGAERGPVVLLYGGPDRGDALILGRQRNGQRATVLHQALPALSEAAVERQAARFHAALAATRVAGEERAAHAVISDILAWLWDSAAAPVLDRLPAGTARVWWSPSGALSALPLHAAGHHAERPTAGPPRTVLDRVTSSYTPTLRALRYARARERRAPADRAALLTVALPRTPGATALPGAEREARALRALLPTRQLSGAEATSDAVRSALPGHPCVHFACHGVGDPADPSAGRLLVHDHQDRPLTVLDISRLDLSGARLAMLSACDTSRTAGRLSDEAIHITSAFQVAGYPHVVGTLWAVHDVVARQVAAAFYRELRGGRERDVPGLDTERAAVALHRATLECRARYPGAPSLWAAHVHAGA
ncbi:CHAT domain-containing tetratricopeptide repeat protein [Streptomyces marincola]|uniref:CHAT domain-containing protein n=1 Tax=Streptomyces marincola TaxID=2878388 RepID=A0A1W7CSX7_9ACTN|nr:CHAT domain-containing protein [Streptomyces marincola]ARQ67809.1 hypothetical protein CAG99_02250 [Streptomyces marincola]